MVFRSAKGDVTLTPTRVPARRLVRTIPNNRSNLHVPHVPFPDFEGMPASLGPGLRTASGAKRRRDGNLRYLLFKIC